MFKKFINQAKKNAEEFLNKPETKEALSKLKTEYDEASKKVGKFLEEGDEILKRKVDDVLNKNKDSKTDVDVEPSKEEVVVEPSKEEVVVEPPQEEVVVESPQEEVVVESPQEEVVVEQVTEPEITVKKSCDIKISEVCESVNLNNKIMQALIDEGVETYDQIEDMSDEEIVALPGIGKATLQKLRDFKY